MTPAAAPPQKRRFGRRSPPRSRRCLVVIAGGAWWLLDAHPPASVATKAPAEAARLSIVVLPFANLSGDPGQDYLVDALTDELTTSLARIRDTFVIARNTAMTFKGKPIDAKAIGKDLGRALCSRRLGAAERRSDEGQRPAHRRRQRRSPLGRTIRHASRRSFADAGRDRRASGEHTRLSTHPGRGRTRQTDARRQSRRRGLGSPMRRGQLWKAGWIGKEADAAYALCEQALAIDPNNVRALTALGVKFWLPAALGVSGDPKGDLERADELESKALALDPDWTLASRPEGLGPSGPGAQRRSRRRIRARARLGPVQRGRRRGPGLGSTYASGNSTKALNISTRRFWRARYDPALAYWYGGKAQANFGLKRYDQAIEQSRQGDRDQSELHPVGAYDPCGGARLDRS